MEKFEVACKYFGEVSLLMNVPVGFVMSDSGKFCVQFSKAKGMKIFTDFKLLMDYFIETYENIKK